MTRLQDVYRDDRVSLREVGLRDGLQLVKAFPSTAAKQRWLRDEYAAGVRHFEVGSFLPASRFPQFADVREIVLTVAALPGAHGIALRSTSAASTKRWRQRFAKLPRWSRQPKSTARPTPTDRATRPLPTSSDSARCAMRARTSQSSMPRSRWRWAVRSPAR